MYKNVIDSMLRGEKVLSVLNSSYSLNLVVLPYNCQASEGCLGQFQKIVERRLKRE